MLINLVNFDASNKEQHRNHTNASNHFKIRRRWRILCEVRLDEGYVLMLIKHVKSIEIKYE